MFRLHVWPSGWAHGLYIESRPTSPKACVAGDMATFWWEKTRPKAEYWINSLWRPHFTPSAGVGAQYFMEIRKYGSIICIIPC